MYRLILPLNFFLCIYTKWTQWLWQKYRFFNWHLSPPSIRLTTSCHSCEWKVNTCKICAFWKWKRGNGTCFSLFFSLLVTYNRVGGCSVAEIARQWQQCQESEIIMLYENTMLRDTAKEDYSFRHWQVKHKHCLVCFVCLLRQGKEKVFTIFHLIGWLFKVSERGSGYAGTVSAEGWH